MLRKITNTYFLGLGKVLEFTEAQICAATACIDGVKVPPLQPPSPPTQPPSRPTQPPSPANQAAPRARDQTRWLTSIPARTVAEHASSHYKRTTRSPRPLPPDLSRLLQQHDEANDKDAAFLKVYTLEMAGIYSQINTCCRLDAPDGLEKYGGYIYGLKRALKNKAAAKGGWFRGQAYRGMKLPHGVRWAQPQKKSSGRVFIMYSNPTFHVLQCHSLSHRNTHLLNSKGHEVLQRSASRQLFLMARIRVRVEKRWVLWQHFI